MTDIITDSRTTKSKVYTVLVDCLGTHQREDARMNQPKGFGEQVTLAELGPNCDVERLLKLGAIKEGVILPARLPDRGDPNRADFQGQRRVNPPAPGPQQLGALGVMAGLPGNG